MSNQEPQTKPDGGASVSTAMLGAGLPTTKWKCDRWHSVPEPVEVIAETAHFVTVRERVFFLDRPDNFRERRMKKDGTIYDTFAGAKTAMVEDAKMRVKYAEAEWQRCKDWLKKCNDMKAPNAEVSGAGTASAGLPG